MNIDIKKLKLLTYIIITILILLFCFVIYKSNVRKS